MSITDRSKVRENNSFAALFRCANPLRTLRAFVLHFARTEETAVSGPRKRPQSTREKPRRKSKKQGGIESKIAAFFRPFRGVLQHELTSIEPNDTQFHHFTRIRAHQPVFIFLLHPSPLSHIVLFHNELGVKEKPILSFTSPFTLEMRESPLLQKNRIFSFILRRKVEKCGGFRPKVFTRNQLIHNHLRKMGEEVKAKNEKPLCAHYARAKPPASPLGAPSAPPPPPRATSPSSRRALAIVKFDRRLPARHAPLSPIFSTKITG